MPVVRNAGAVRPRQPIGAAVLLGAEMLPVRLHDEDQFTHEDVAPAIDLEASYSGVDRRRERRPSPVRTGINSSRPSLHAADSGGLPRNRGG